LGLGFPGFVGIHIESNSVANEGLFWFERQICWFHVATRVRGGQRRVEKMCHEANGYSQFDASTRVVRYWLVPRAKRLRNNEL
jgi:hypothetical protein